MEHTILTFQRILGLCSTTVLLQLSTPVYFLKKTNSKSLELFDTIKLHASVDQFLNDHDVLLEEVLFY